MTLEQERELWEIAQNTSNAVLHRLMDFKRHGGMSLDEWEFYAIKTLAAAQTSAEKIALDAIMRTPVPNFIIPDKRSPG